MQLYNHTEIGTKRVVEDYILEVQKSLQFLLQAESPLISDAQKLEHLTCFRQVFFKPTSVLIIRHMGELLYFFPEERLLA
jgi:hypothetical protein